MRKSVDKDVDLVKAQICHEFCINTSISKISYILSWFLTMALIFLSFPVQGLNGNIQFIVGTIAIFGIIGVIAYAFWCIKSYSREYNQRLKKISEMLEEVKQGRELPKLEVLLEKL
jgi:positive regulator of sigma E activity